MLSKIAEILKDKKYAKPIIAMLLVIAIFMIYKRRNSKDDHINSLIIPIEAAAVTLNDLPIYLEAIGTVIPDNTAIVKPQVNGQLIKIAFNDGQKVKKGDLLAQIDPVNYKAQLTQAEGQLLRDQAILENSMLDLKRYQDLWKHNSVSKQILDTQTALVKQNQGNVQIDQGLVDNAKANLSYCDIVAPFDGVMGIAAVSEGNLVQSTDQNGIGVINSIDPISVLFSVPETEASKIIAELNKEALKVEVYDQSSKTIINAGILTAIDNQIDTATGTIRLKAEFKNADNSLYPNQFVNVKLLVRTIKDAIAIPTSAVQHGPNGTFVYLLNDEKTKVRVHPVAVDVSSGPFTIIKNGLLEKQKVAVSGVDKLRDDALITVSGSDL